MNEKLRAESAMELAQMMAESARKDAVGHLERLIETAEKIKAEWEAGESHYHDFSALESILKRASESVGTMKVKAEAVRMLRFVIED